MPLQATAVTYALPIIKSDSYRDVPKYRLLNSDGLSGNNDLRILALMRVHEYSVQYVYVYAHVHHVYFNSNSTLQTIDIYIVYHDNRLMHTSVK